MGLPWGGMETIIDAIVGHFVEYFYVKYVKIISLKALGNYSDEFWFNKISNILCEGPKPNMSMTYGFLSPGEPLFMDLNIQKNTSRNVRKNNNLFGKY